MKKYQKWNDFYQSLERLGISQEDADSLRRIELTLSRWSERECNGDIQRDEQTGKVYQNSIAWMSGSTNENRRHLVYDRETNALKRLEKIMAKYPNLWSYYQTDPRGCSLYVGRKTDLGNHKIESVYTRGVAVCL